MSEAAESKETEFLTQLHLNAHRYIKYRNKRQWINVIFHFEHYQ